MCPVSPVEVSWAEGFPEFVAEGFPEFVAREEARTRGCGC